MSNVSRVKTIAPRPPVAPRQSAITVKLAKGSCVFIISMAQVTELANRARLSRQDFLELCAAFDTFQFDGMRDIASERAIDEAQLDRCIGEPDEVVDAIVDVYHCNEDGVQPVFAEQPACTHPVSFEDRCRDCGVWIN